MKLEVGEFYLNANGEIIKIVEIHINNSNTEFYDSNSNSYSENGKFYIESIVESCIDLIAHIPKELHFDIIKTIKAYHSDNSIKEYIDYAYNNKGN